MKNFNNLDLFDKLKLDIVKLCISFKILKEEVIVLLATNKWILDDSNLFENYTKLQKMIEESDEALSSLINETISLENNGEFLVEDIICEYNLISENIDLEMFYLLNMMLYMEIKDDYTLNLKQIEEILDVYNVMDKFYFENMKLNNKQLKVLKKERRDYFE